MLSRYAARVAQDLAQDAERLRLTPSSDAGTPATFRAPTAAASTVKTLLQRLQGCCHRRVRE